LSFSLISLDVVSLFTNIPIDSALDSISKRWCFISEECNIEGWIFESVLTNIKFKLFYIWQLYL